MFLIPGIGNAMRVNGMAFIENDPALLDSFTVEGKTLRRVMVVKAGEVYFRCARGGDAYDNNWAERARQTMWRRRSHSVMMSAKI